MTGLLEAQTFRADRTFTADVCIVGSGPGGAVAAALLAKAGKRVVVLEAGGAYTAARFAGREADAFPALYQDGGSRQTADGAISILQGKALGGGSTINWTTCFRTPPRILEQWRAQHEVSGLDEARLAPHFAAMEQRLSVQRAPDHAVNANNQALHDGAAALGFHPERLHRNTKGCAMSGACGLGCPIDAKQSMLVTLLPDAVQDGATIVTRAPVHHLVHDGTRVTAAIAHARTSAGDRATGVQITVKAARFIVAAGAIGSPALLLRSGLPDPHARLGRRTFLHPVIASFGIMPDPVHGYHGAPQSVAAHAHIDRGDDVGFFLEAAPLYPMLAAVALPGHGAAHDALMRKLSHAVGHLALTVDGLHPDVPGGRVTLDKYGAPRLDYPVVPKLQNAFRDAQKVLARVQLAAGARVVMSTHGPPVAMRTEADIRKLDDVSYGPHDLAMFSAHQMGGCSMSDAAQQGVVHPETLRHHQVKNLHVVDGSVFPTALGVNPQMSIYGLAHHAVTGIATL